LIHGRIKEDAAVGGGMCSVSTTLFNAALRAGLPIVERHAHALHISRYPVGLDATVWDLGSRHKTMGFVNDTGHPIHIRAINGRGRVTFELYGFDDGRTVELSRPRIENRRDGLTYMEYTDDLAPGERKRVADSYDRLESWVTRIVRDAHGNEMDKKTFHSRYRKIDGLVKVGRYPDDPTAGTRILASEYSPSSPQ
jgi:vancomycin resistance protein YoaR